MQKKQLFHSYVLGIGVIDAYHSHPECQIAQTIAESDRLPGKGHNRPHCRFCLMHYGAWQLHGRWQPAKFSRVRAVGQVRHLYEVAAAPKIVAP
jgi:hypothetical protein